MERLGTELGKRFDDLIAIQQPQCPSCGAQLPRRKPGVRARIEQLMRVLKMARLTELTAELARVNALRGRSHGGRIPEGPDLLAPERLAGTILQAVIERPEKAWPD